MQEMRSRIFATRKNSKKMEIFKIKRPAGGDFTGEIRRDG